MNNTLKLAAALIAAGAVAAPALAQSNTANGTASTTIVAPITVVKDVDLRFGTLVKGSASQTASIAADTGTFSYPGTTAPSTRSRAEFTVSGEGGQTFSVNVPGTVAMTGPGTDITVTLASQVDSGTATTGTLSGSLGSSGNRKVYVGGSFPVAPSQATGAYSGTFAVTVNYN